MRVRRISGSVVTEMREVHLEVETEWGVGNAITTYFTAVIKRDERGCRGYLGNVVPRLTHRAATTEEVLERLTSEAREMALRTTRRMARRPVVQAMVRSIAERRMA